MQTMPGGNLISGMGGYLQLWNWTNSTISTGVTPAPQLYNYLDVAYWQLRRQWISPMLTYSGCLGATRRRFVASDWTLHARVWWDYNFPPEIVFQNGDTLAVKLVIGAESTWSGFPVPRTTTFQADTPYPFCNQQVVGFPANGYGILPEGATFLPSYCSPMGIFSAQDVYDSSEGNEDGIVYQDVQIEGDSWMYYLHNNNDAAAYTQYVQTLANRNMIAFN